MREVTTSTISGQEASRKISVVRKDGGMIINVLQHVKPVLMLRWIRMFGSESVVNGDDDSGNFKRESATSEVIDDGTSAEGGEPAAVKEEEDG